MSTPVFINPTLRLSLLGQIGAIGALCVIWFFRAYRFDQVGIQGADVFFYWDTAYNWSRGLEDLTNHYRPLIYWVHGLVFRLTGPNDWALKLTHLFFDLGTLLTIYTTGYYIRKSVWVGFVAALFYASMPHVLELTRSEIVHAPSTFFMVLACMLFLGWTRDQSGLKLGFCGFFHGVAWHVHPDLAVLGLPFALIIAWKVVVTSKIKTEDRIVELVRYLGIYIVGYIAVFMVFIIRFNLVDLLLCLKKGQGAQAVNQEFIPLKFLRFLWTYLNSYFGVVGTTVLITVLGLRIYKKNWLNSETLLLVILPVTYAAFAALMFGRYLLPRLFMPLVPLLCLFLVTALWDLGKARLIAIFGFSFALLNHQAFTYSFREPVSPYRHLEAEMAPILKHDSRYLISPLSTFEYHSPLSKKTYLDGRGVYLVNAQGRSLDEVIMKNGISHVWVSNILEDLSIFREHIKGLYVERLSSLYGLEPSQYDRTQEIETIKKFLQKRGAKLVSKSTLGEIYEL